MKTFSTNVGQVVQWLTYFVTFYFRSQDEGEEAREDFDGPPGMSPEGLIEVRFMK